jgi:hypothetical protein
VSTAPFDPAAYKRTTTDQWQMAAEPWHRWGAAWSEIERELSRYETADGFEGPCELLVAADAAPA